MKKVLIITYYWPPAGGPGVQRWLKFVKYLPDFEVEPVVFCPLNPSYPVTDESLLKEVPKDLNVIKQPIREPYRFAELFSKKRSKSISSGMIPKEKKQSLVEKLLLFVRGNFFIPDARKNWVTPSVAFLKNYLQEQQIDTIITTGPPHSLHLIGLKLKKDLGITWLADFRDPWTTIGYHKKLKLTSSAKEKHLKMEASVLHDADQIIVTSENTKAEFQQKTKTPITVITNGYDTQNSVAIEKDKTFSLAHIGSLLSGRNPILLWEALSELIEEIPNFKSFFELKLIGLVSEDVLQTLADFGLEPYLHNLGYVPHDQAQKAQHESQVLLLIEIDSEDTKVIVPGKLFEYMAANTPILAIGPTDSDVEQIIKKTNTGHYFYYAEKQKIKHQIQQYFEAYQANDLSVNAIGLQQYSRKSLTQQLAGLVKNQS